MEFDEWMGRIDELVKTEIGLSVHDLADMCWRDWYDDGLTPSDAWQTAKEDGVLT